jgi:hypothetical protein
MSNQMMNGQDRHSTHLAFVLVVSIFGLVISGVSLRNPVSFVVVSADRRVMMALAYDLVCIIGMAAVLFPVACSKIVGVRGSLAQAPEQLGIRATEFLGVQILHGHHTSEDSAKHELLITGKSFCATCYGLLTGAVLSFAIITAFALSGWSGWADGSPACFLYCIGVAAVITGLLQILTPDVGAKARFISASVFVLGTSLILLATDLLAANLMSDLFIILLAVFWLLSRISLSHRS